MFGDLLKRYNAGEKGSLDSTTITETRFAAKDCRRRIVRKYRSWVSSSSSPTAHSSAVISRLVKAKSVTRWLDLDMKSEAFSVFYFENRQ
ncbi:hypothetical protein [Frigidibacter sp.]|uniref:hypothetical protein n=1 Tax=Frigidibacter sp. TaxID=2586418 RepID=UPI002734B267|nr:hypothetical protein [Frigidibacter sp.]MDP3340085.1 hypothetical protein [Frigidibacter sp.]